MPPTTSPPHIKSIDLSEAENGELFLTATGHDDQLFGTVHIEPRNGTTVYLRDLHVPEEIEGKGTGTALLEETKAVLRRRGTTRIECDVSAYRGEFRNPQPRRRGDQLRLERIYRRAGFEADPDAMFGSWSCVL